MQYRTVGFLPRLRDSFWRHRLLFLLAVVISSGIMTTALALRKPTFHASAATQVVTAGSDMQIALGGQQTNSWVSESQQQVNHFNDLLNDDRPDGFLDTALKNARLNPPISVDPRTRDPRAGRLAKSLSVTADSATLFSVGLTWEDPAECERIVQSLQDQYIEEIGVERQTSSVRTTKFLESEIASYEKRLSQAEQALITYKQANSGELPEAQMADIQQLTSLKTQKDTLLISAQNSDMKRQAIEARIAQIPVTSILSQTYGNDPNAIAQRDIITQKNALLAQGMAPTSDRIRDMDERLANINKMTAAEIAKAKTGAVNKNITETKIQSNPEYQSLSQQLTEATIAQRTQKAELQNVTQKIAEYEVRIQKIPEAQRSLTNKTRDYSLLKGQYESLKKLREDALLKSNLDKITARATLVSVGTVYAQPTTPRSKQLVLFAGSILLGLIVGIVVVILSEWSDTTLRYGGDAERLLDIPVLAELGEMRMLTGASAPSGSFGRGR